MSIFSSYIAETDEVFFQRNSLNIERIQPVIDDVLSGMDDGELFLEYCQSEGLTFDDGVLKQSSFDTVSGFGFRGVLGEATGYAHASDISFDAITRAADTLNAVKSGYSGAVQLDTQPSAAQAPLYAGSNPLLDIAFAEKVATLKAIDAYVRGKEPCVKQVSASISGEWQAVQIIRAGGYRVADLRPLVRLNVSIIVEKNGRMETGSMGVGGRDGYSPYLLEANWKQQADDALRQAVEKLESIPAPAGEMPVVLGPGWPGVLLHEAVGHGLEGDFNRKQTSAFSGLVGERVASPGVTVVDDGTIKDRRGSLTIDDEGTPSQHTVLIEDGILKGYMQDRLNARLMGKQSTGNGRRESYAHMPMPRMTNTYMLSGDKTQEEIIASVDKGIFAKNFGGGQVDIVSGKFVFSATEAYLIENGKVTTPVKGATLIGNGPDVLTKVSAIGNDMELDRGVGTCGKDGQQVPVGVGQPTLLIDSMTVGGTSM